VLLRRIEDIVPLVRRISGSQTLLAEMRHAAAALGVPDATQRIVGEISSLIPAPGAAS
jgi:UDP-N-acetylglucosamine:LPS N-acetylglucosamine transferase